MNTKGTDSKSVLLINGWKMVVPQSACDYKLLAGQAGVRG